MACPSDRSPDNSDTHVKPSACPQPCRTSAPNKPQPKGSQARTGRADHRPDPRDDEDAPAKQRHTAAQIHRRLRDQHAYPGGYAQVQRYVLKHRRHHRETFIPLGHLPGQRLEADFGHIHVDFPDGRRLVPFLVTAWAYSNAPFALALPFERTEAILQGMVAAFEFFGGVPKEVWWDNPRTLPR